MFIKTEKEALGFSATLGQDRFGKRIQVTRRGFKTQGEARRGLEELKQSFSDSQGIYLQGITFHDFYREYFFLGISWEL